LEDDVAMQNIKILYEKNMENLYEAVSVTSNPQYLHFNIKDIHPVIPDVEIFYMENNFPAENVSIKPKESQ
jgi:hypothetical protein